MVADNTLEKGTNVSANVEKTLWKRRYIKTPGKKYATINDRLQHVVSRYEPDDKIAFLKSIAHNLHSFWRLWLINVIHVINLSDQDDKIDILKSIAPNSLLFECVKFQLTFSVSVCFFHELYFIDFERLCS